MKQAIYLWAIVVIVIGAMGCEPLVTKFPENSDAIKYSAQSHESPPAVGNSLLIMTWNIRFGAARIPWFGDSCGERVILTKAEVQEALSAIADKINEVQPDILLVQEVDVESNRTGYINQVQWLLDHTYFNYAAYGSMWKSQFVPSDGLGRINTGQAVFSRWELSDTERIQLALRGDQDALTTYFYLRRNILKTKVMVPEIDNLYVLNIHASAFSTDDTKQQHVTEFKEVFDALDSGGALVIGGGDFNLLPPGSDSTNYCDEDRCQDDDPDFCPEGSDYTPEMTWMEPIYNAYSPAVSLSDYLASNSRYFTHSTSGDVFWNRKLDYLFTNGTWSAGTDSTYQETMQLADHAPVSARLAVQP